MPFHFGIPNTSGKQVSHALNARRLNLLKTAPSALKLVGLHTITQPGYHAFISCLPAAMEATLRQTEVRLDQEGYPIRFPVADCMPFPYPNLAFTLPSPPNAADQPQFEELGATRIKLQERREIFTLEGAEPSSVRFLKSLQASPTTPAPVNHVNLNAYDSVILVVRILSSYLRTHNYPAFQDDEHVDDFQRHIIATRKRSRVTVQESQGGGPSKQARLEVPARDETQEPTDTESNAEEATTSQNVRLRRIRPSNPSAGWGSSGTVPQQHGMLFPYVQELANPDQEAVYQLVSTYFVKALGTTMATQATRLDELKSSLGIVAKTTTGHVLAHLATCISIAIPAQARCFPLFSDRVYEGCVILGAGWSVAHRGKISRPLPSTNLAQEIAAQGSHSVSMRRITEILSGDDDIEMNEDDMITSMWSLHEKCVSSSVSQAERNEILALALHLQFRTRKWAINSRSIITCLELIAGISEFDDDCPIHVSQLFAEDRTALALSCFGFEAPSFIIPNGTNKEITRGGGAPSHVTVRSVALPQAIIDMNTMLKDRYIRFSTPSLSARFKYRQFDATDKTTIWGAVVRASEGKMTSAGQEEQGSSVVEADIDDW